MIQRTFLGGRLSFPLLSMLEQQASESAQTTATPPMVKTIRNHVYFYMDVTAANGLMLIEELQSLDDYLQSERRAQRLPVEYPPIPIWLHIQSDGGDAFTGLNLIDQIQQDIQSPVYSVIEGLAASAATFISVACAKRFIRPHSHMLIHQLSGEMWGTHEQFKDAMAMQTSLMDKIRMFYAERSKLSPNEIDELLKRDAWLDAKQALATGLVDEVMGGYRNENF